MIKGINFSAYHQIARMKSTLNSYMRQVTIAKAQLNVDIAPQKLAGIGRNIDYKA